MGKRAERAEGVSVVFMCIFGHVSSCSITPTILDGGTLSYQQKRELIHANTSLSLSYLTMTDLLDVGEGNVSCLTILLLETTPTEHESVR